MPPERNPPTPSNSGIFSSVLGYVSREIESFVATATGGAASQPEVRDMPTRTGERASRPFQAETPHATECERHSKLRATKKRRIEQYSDDEVASPTRPVRNSGRRRQRTLHEELSVAESSVPSPTRRKQPKRRRPAPQEYDLEDDQGRVVPRSPQRLS
jgi:hypothetical protein